MLINADAFYIPLADKSVHCCVTSPPYWGLRKYSGKQGDEPLGWEATPELHVERMVEIFREVRRVLRDDGVCWMNYGDCYGGSGGENGNLMLMPHRVAIALQDDGWIVRNDVVWHKPNPMPESVAGWRFENGKLRRSSWRHTRSHEYVFQLTKKMQYWSNQEAVREAMSPATAARYAYDFKPVWTEAKGNADPAGGGYRGDSTFDQPPVGRNPRSVMEVPTAPYSGAHYATYPPNLIAPLIRATCPRWACPVCGQGWAPVVEKHGKTKRETMYELGKSEYFNAAGDALNYSGGHDLPERQTSVKGYRPTCEHEHTKAEAVPGIVFDPFVGSGTTVMVAQELLRRGVGIDLSCPYLDEQARIRVGMGGGKAEEGLPLWNGWEADDE